MQEAKLIKYASLVVYFCLTTMGVLLRRYSRVYERNDLKRYLTSTAVFSSDVVGFGLCLVALFVQCGNEFSPKSPSSFHERKHLYSKYSLRCRKSSIILDKKKILINFCNSWMKNLRKSPGTFLVIKSLINKF
jgi:hypothetical protein